MLSDHDKQQAKHLASIGRAVGRVNKKFEMETRLPQTTQVDVVSQDEIRIGKLLGRGGFNDVREVRICRPELPATQSYAIKHLSKNIMKEYKSYKCGAVDLSSEAKLLSLLNHKNIISVHGIAQALATPGAIESGGYFLIIDKLASTVEDKLKTWRENHVKSRPAPLTGLLHRRTTANVERAAMRNRLRLVAQPVADALKYLHANNVIYRDLKPQNMGFASDGTLKLFDFGLAREIVDPERRMTASTGSRRYMAPEVALGEFYDLSADVYSFGIFLWELVTLEKPFDAMSRSTHEALVIEGGVRPKVNRSTGTPALQKLIQRSWDTNAGLRPTFEDISKILQVEIEEGKIRAESPPARHVKREDNGRRRLSFKHPARAA